MRLTLLVFSLFLVVCPLVGQSQFTFEPQANTDGEVAYLHILYIGQTSWAGYRLRTTLAPNDPVKLSPNSYTLLKISEDYVGFFADPGESTKPLVLDLERGKHYFYRFSSVPHGLEFGTTIDELTEKEFKMELFFNGIDPDEPKRTYELEISGS